MTLQNPLWLFVIASAICVVGIVSAFKQMVSSIVSSVHMEGPELKSLVAREFRRFIVKLAFIETVPMILLCFGMLQVLGSFQIIDHPVIEPVVPLIVTLLIMAFGGINIFLTRVLTLQDPYLSDSAKQYVANQSIIVLTLSNAIPLISLVFCIMVLTGSV
jgi:hypothetical protein